MFDEHNPQETRDDFQDSEYQKRTENLDCATNELIVEIGKYLEERGYKAGDPDDVMICLFVMDMKYEVYHVRTQEDPITNHYILAMLSEYIARHLNHIKEGIRLYVKSMGTDAMMSVLLGAQDENKEAEGDK